MPTSSELRERKDQQQRAQAWYAVVGFGVLVAGVAVIMAWMPDNPFSRPSELPNTTRLNASTLTGHDAPMLAVTPSQQAAIGPGCRVSDVSLVQNHRGAFQRTITEALLARSSRRGFASVGWTAGAGGDGGVGCEVVYRFREGATAREARWTISDDRAVITPANDQALALERAMTPRRR